VCDSLVVLFYKDNPVKFHFEFLGFGIRVGAFGNREFFFDDEFEREFVVRNGDGYP